MLVRILSLFVILSASQSFALIGGQKRSLDTAAYSFKIDNCGASKLANDTFITAAHCLPFSPRQGVPADLSLTMKKAISLQPRQEEKLQIQAIYVEPHFFKDYKSLGISADQTGYDLAIVQVVPSPAFSQLPILGLNRDPLFIGQEVRVMGWGNSYDSLGSRSEDQYSGVFRSGLSRIREIQPPYIKIDESQGLRSALGDSGSPLISKDTSGQDYLVGITAHQDQGGGNQRYSAMTPEISQWITQVLTGNESPLPKISRFVPHQRLKNSYAMLAQLSFPGSFDKEGQQIRCWTQNQKNYCATAEGKTTAVAPNVYKALKRIFSFEGRRHQRAYLYCKQWSAELICLTSPSPMSSQMIYDLMSPTKSVF